MNGVMIEPNNNSARWDVSALDQQTAFVLDKLKPGEVSEPQLLVMPDGSKSYRLLRLGLRTEPHRANLKDDYRLIQQAAEGKQRSEAIDRWVGEKLEGTYTLDADCTGTITFGGIMNPSSNVHWDLYVTENRKRGHMIRMDEGNMAVRSFEK